MKKIMGLFKFIHRIKVALLNITKKEVIIDEYKLHTVPLTEDLISIGLGSKVLTSDDYTGIIIRISHKLSDIEPYKVLIDGDILKVNSYSKKNLTLLHKKDNGFKR